MLYEGGIRVPLIVRVPKAWGGRDPGVCRVPVSAVDIVPTVLEWARVPNIGTLGGPWILDGVSIASLFRSAAAAPSDALGTSSADRQTLETRALFWHFPAYLQGKFEGRGPWRTTPAGAIRRGSFKLIEWFEDGLVELYDLSEDLGERRDLAKQHPGIAAELHAELRAWRQQTKAPVPTRPEPKFDPEALERARG